MKKLMVIGVVALVLGSCGRAQSWPDGAAYEQDILQWRAERLEALKARSGYLNQVGLFWLDEGSHSVGSAPGSDVRLPSSAAADIGVFDVSADGVRMRVHAGVDVISGDEAVTDLLIADDTTEAPVEVTHGSIAWTVIKRDDRFAIRVRDFEHPFVETFGPLSYFPIDTSLRVPATLQRYDAPRVANVDTVIEGLGYHPESPGVVSFEIEGERFELEAYASGERLFFVFGDVTNRDETYGAGRFLYADLPGADGKTIMDFNRSYSPPCAFNDFSTCPVASPRNRLPIRIEAGEKYDPALHYVSDIAH